MLFGVYMGRFCVKWVAKCMWEAHTGPNSCDTGGGARQNMTRWRLLQKGNRMSLRLADLHVAYHTVGPDEAIVMANLGAVCYEAVRGTLRDEWVATMAGDDAAKAEKWREEGRMALMESVKAKLAAADDATARAIAAESQLGIVNASVEAEAAKRVAVVLDGHRKDMEIAKMVEIGALKERIASLEGQKKAMEMLEEAQCSMKQVIEEQKVQLAAYKEQVQVALKANTRSSHAIGKQGEATVLEILEGHVMAVFPYSQVKDMTSVHHAADFHIWIMNETGKRKKFLVDSKNYSQPVNSTEVIKLYKDVDADDEAGGGILISLSSPIAAKKQFQIGYTPKQKPLLFLTFMDMELEVKKDILCWAIHALMAIVGESDHAARNKMLENIEEFMESVHGSVKELDKVILSQVKTLEATRQVRSGILHKLTGFREGNDGTVPAITHVEDDGVVDDGGCVSILKSTGLRCGKVVTSGRTKCRNHTSAQDKKGL